MSKNIRNPLMDKHNNNNGRKNNYFRQNIQSKGENFLNYKSSYQLERDCINLFRQFADGRIDIDEFGEYFLHESLLNAALRVSWRESLYRKYVYDCMVACYNTSMTSGQYIMKEFSDAVQRAKGELDAYSMLNEMFNLLATSRDLSLMKTYQYKISVVSKFI